MATLYLASISERGEWVFYGSLDDRIYLRLRSYEESPNVIVAGLREEPNGRARISRSLLSQRGATFSGPISRV